jgi:hypothetical protein
LIEFFLRSFFLQLIVLPVFFLRLANGLLVPKPTGQVTTKEETLEFLTEWFKWIEDQNDFHHWFGMIKKYVIIS